MIAGDVETRVLYLLAMKLGLTLGQVLDLPVEEVRGWIAFLEWLSEQERK